MIVDLLRNDVARVAETGSVQVPELFTVEPAGWSSSAGWPSACSPRPTWPPPRRWRW